MKKQKIAVIGMGPAGIVTAKELLEKGHDVHCFEQGKGMGGVFCGDNSYDSLKLTVTNYFMAYSDFMPYEESIHYWTCREYKQYLERYAARFDLYSHTQFNTTIEKMERLSSGEWELTIKHHGEKESQEAQRFDRVALCIGQFGAPVIPDVPGIDAYEGELMHSSEYKNTEQIAHYKDKNVLCIGVGETAADVTYEVASVAKHAVVAMNRHHIFASRSFSMAAGDELSPTEFFQTRFYHSLPAKSLSSMLLAVWKTVVDGTFTGEASCGPEAAYEMMSHHMGAGDLAGSVVTKAGGQFRAVVDHGLEIDIGGIERIEGKTVHFKSGRVEDFDAIVLCTGYRFLPKMLDERYHVKDVRSLYLQMFHPDLGDSLAFIGLVRPLQGGVPLLAELQARYYALICAGERHLPKALAELAQRDGDRWRQEFYETPHVAGLVNGLRYGDTLAELVGCRLEEPSFWRSPRKFMKFWFGHVWPSRYRSVGTGALPTEKDRWAAAPYHSGLNKLSVRLILLIQITYHRLMRFLETDEKLQYRKIYDTRYVTRGEEQT